ncbi:hypothetical protein EI77_00403 [Prosthecobacter fusiformis]|uniref:DUF1287 domain-containing protein n=1 Tax=Prosthecobacter fusiformis TaxID=48464 RepID=A0A4R7SQ11_9BACT|nr:DUF1287 domain-containing protein [Prosthecobacter fusiformis]TDU81101.1 hypothetical protein EI77_00403 [Prosthecobacter fusiformis]
MLNIFHSAAIQAVSRMRLFPIAILVLLASICRADQTELAAASRSRLPIGNNSFAVRLCHAALDRTAVTVRYDGAYLRIPYPGGDVPAETGVCTDEVIRSYRVLGFDLQKLVHEDMKRNFSAYPKNWGLPKPDTNIDHRRVPNLQTFFKRKRAALPTTQNPADYKPGDLITCTVAGRLPHIALVVPAPDGGDTPWIVHNIGSGPMLENRLFEFPLTGHYRWHPEK